MDLDEEQKIIHKQKESEIERQLVWIAHDQPNTQNT